MKKLILIYFLAFSYTLCAQSYRNTYAVIVAVADYENFNILSGDLNFTINDAKKFSAFLMSKQGGSVSAKNIYLLTEEKAKKANIIHYTNKLFSRAKPGDRVIFYFSGHGAPGCFLPYDVSNSGAHMLYFSEVKKLFKSANCQTKLLFADACHSGSLKKKSNKDLEKSLGKENSAQKGKSTNIAVMLSSRANETSIEKGNLKQGLFSYNLIQALEGSADANSDGLLTIEEVFHYVHKKTVSIAKEQANHNQHPILFGDFDLDLVIAKVY
jgi:uncharacterized caspase-like protein